MFAKMKRLGALMLVLAMVFSLLPAGIVLAAEAPVAETLTQADYADADSVFDLIDEAESSPAKKNATQEEKTEAAMAIVMASDSYVEGSLVRNGDSFTWWTDDGIRCVYSPRMRDISEDLTPEEGENEIVNEPVAVKGGSPTGNQVYLIGPYYGHDSSFTNQYKNEAKRVAEAIGDSDGYTLYSGTAATVDKVAEAVSNGAVVFFDSHGMTDYENSKNEYDCSTGATQSYLCLTSTTGLTTEDYNDGALYYSDGICINGATIANHMTKNSPSGILWMAICLGMATNTMCEPLRAMGVEVVYGYSESVTFEGDYRFEKAFWDAMVEGKTVAESIAAMKAKWGDYDWSTQIANDYGSYDGYTSVREAQNDFSAFPVVVSDEDVYPGKRTTSSYGASSLQTVLSTYTLFTACDHVWTQATCTTASTCTLCGRTNGKPLPHTDANTDDFCDVCGKDISVAPNTYIKVTETPDDWSGQYLIVWEGGSLAFNGTLHSDQALNSFSVVIENDMIVLDDADADKYFVIAAADNGYYTIQTPDGYYIGNTSGRNKVEYSKTYDYTHDLDIDAEGSVLIEADDYSILRFNKTQDQMRFRFYKTGSYASQEPVALYKLVDGSSSGGTTCSHNYGSGVTTTAPTCTTAGVITYTCTLCGETKTESIAATGHNWLNATCTAPKTCSVCGATTGSAAAHTDNNSDNACDNCGASIGSAQPPAGTTGSYVLITSADQLTSGQYVMIADKGYGPGVYSSGWLTAVKPTVDGTVVTDTQNAVWTLTVNGSSVVLTDSNGATVKPKGGNNNGISTGSYNWAWEFSNGTFKFKGTGSDTVTLASNTASGNQFRAYKNSTVSGGAYPCNFKLYKLVEETTHQHTAGAAVTENQVAANCTTAGSYDSVVYCSGCNQEMSRVTVTVPATGHAYDNDQDASCNNCGAIREIGPVADSTLNFLAAPGLSFQDYIGMQVLVPNATANKYDRIYVVAVQADPAGDATTILEGAPYFGVYQLFEQQILSWSMTENVTLTLYAEKNGATYVGQTVSASVQSLTMEKLVSYYEDVNLTACRALVDMLNYGAAVQTAFNHNASSLPNADLGKYSSLGSTGALKMNAENVKTGTGTVAVTKDSISMQAKVEIQMLFTTNISAYTAKATMNGTEVPVVIDTETMGAYGWTLVRVAIGAANMRDTYSIALYDAAGKPVTEIYHVSVEAYGQEQLEGTYNDVVVAMMRYGDSVAAL